MWHTKRFCWTEEVIRKGHDHFFIDSVVGWLLVGSRPFSCLFNRAELRKLFNLELFGLEDAAGRVMDSWVQLIKWFWYNTVLDSLSASSQSGPCSVQWLSSYLSPGLVVRPTDTEFRHCFFKHLNTTNEQTNHSSGLIMIINSPRYNTWLSLWILYRRIKLVK